MTAYEQTIIQYIQSEILIAGDSLTVETPLIGQGIVDSLRIFRLVSFLETTFGVEFEPTDVVPQHFHSVQSLAAFVQGKTAV